MEQLNKQELIRRAEALVPLLRETARESEIARPRLDRVIDAVRKSGLFSLMVPTRFGGHELSGHWQWGTGIVHASWVIAGAILSKEDGSFEPMFFTVPRADVELVDTWNTAGMCGTGSHDFKIDHVFVPKAQALKFQDMLNLDTGIRDLYDADLYRTPMLVILGMAGALPVLGAAKSAVYEFCEQTKKKLKNSPNAQVERTAREPLAAKAALDVELAEMMMRAVLSDVMARRDTADRVVRAEWLAKLSHAVGVCRTAVNYLCEGAGASVYNLDNPIQRALRDINSMSGHVLFDREVRYRDLGNIMTDRDPLSTLL